MEYAIETIGLKKQFPKVLANDNINLKIRKGKIHALVGENGAGKSTLMNMLYGLYRPTAGVIKVNGKQVDFFTPNDALKLGIGMVHQHFMLIPNLTVYENIILGNEPKKKFSIDRDFAIKQVQEVSEKYNIEIDPRKKIEDLTVGEQQRVEIVKVLYRGVDTLILDEPTAVLTPQEIQELFNAIRFLISKGKTVIIITHKLDEVMDISDDISVLRRGVHVETIKKEDANIEMLTKLMVGRSIELGGKERKQTEKKQDILQVKNLTVVNRNGVKKLENVSFEVKTGEILGIAGVDGNGQLEIVESITGLNSSYSGEIIVDGTNVNHYDIRRRREKGISCIPEDRHKHGLLLNRSINDNMIMGMHYKKPFAKNGIFNATEIVNYSNAMIKSFDIRTPNGEVNAGTLSGGNQQKIIVARELYYNSDLVLAVQPTRGLDVGAIEYIHNVLVETRNKGKGILLVSLEIDEVMQLADRIIVVNSGKIVGELPKSQFNKNKIGMMMLGMKGENMPKTVPADEINENKADVKTNADFINSKEEGKDGKDER